MEDGTAPAAGAGFAVALRRLRADAGLSQEVLAERAGLSVRGLRYLERGVRHPYRSTAERLSRALGLDPGPSAALVSAAVSARASGQERERRASSLPVPPSPLVGRERELREALGLLRRAEVRLVTVTGPGGVGKTRFALDLADRLARAVAATVVWVPLAALTDAALVPVAVARAVGVTPQAPRQLVEVLAGTLEEQILLLDNAEHVVGSAPFVSDLVARCPSLTVIVTSRVTLGIRAEQRFPLDPLRTPDPAADIDVHALAVNPAVDLFVARTRTVDPRFSLTRTNAHAVAAICQRLEGFPLALELAAARTAVLPPEALSGRLEHGLDLLASGAPDVPDRQRTMRATIAWSYALLAPADRALFRQLAAFEGGVALTSAEALPVPARRAGDEVGGQDRLLAHLETLVRSSLLRIASPVLDQPRYRMHGLIREYGLEELAREGEEPRVRRWHAEHFLCLAEQAERHFYGPGSSAWLDRLDVEHANLRAALQWFSEGDRPDQGLRLGGALSWFWYVRGHATEGRSHLAALLAAAGPSAEANARMSALLGAGQLAQTQGDYGTARRLLDQSVTLGRTTGDRSRTAAALLAGGFVARIQEDYAAATRMLEEAARLAADTGPPFVVAATRHHLGMIAADARGDLATARDLLQDSLESYRELGMSRFVALVLLSLAQVAGAGGDLRSAGDLAHHSLALMRDTGERLGLHGALDTLAELAVAHGDLAYGVRLAGAAEHLRELSGTRSWPVVERQRERFLTTARAGLTPEDYRNHWDDGYSMTVGEVVDLALCEAPAQP